MLVACGGPPQLPPVEPAPIIAPTGDAAIGAGLFADRDFGRTGLACADCHPGPEAGLRPAPSLDRWARGDGRWAGAPRPPAESLRACIERFQARRAPTAVEAGHLRSAVRATTAPAPTRPPEPEALYRAACMHCHEAGPAGPLTGRRLLSATLRRAVRMGPAPGHRMPRFDPATLPDRAFEGLVDWLLGPAAGSDTLSP